MPRRTNSRRGAVRPRSRLISGLLVGGVVLVTVVGALVARDNEDEDLARERRDTVDNTVAQLHDGFARTAAVLATANVMVDGNGYIDTARLEVFSRVLLAPGGPATALAYEPVVLHEDRARFEALMGAPIVDRSIDGSGFVRAPVRDVYYPVMAVQPPTDTTRQVLGFDIAQDDARGDAARRAASSGAAELTAVVALAPSTRTGFLIVQPLTASGRVVGFLTIGYVGENAGRSILAGLPVGSGLRVRDGGQVLFDSGDVGGTAARTTVELGGRSWDLDIELPLTASRTLSTVVLAIGLSMAALIAVESELSHRNERALVHGRQQLALERDLATGLAAAATSADVAARAAALIPDVVGARLVRVGLRDDDRPVLPALGPGTGDADDDATWDRDRLAPLQRLVEDGEPVLVRDRADLARRFPALAAAGWWPGGSFAFLPIRVGADALGVLGVAYEGIEPCDDEQIRRLSDIATMIGGALERANLHDTNAHVALTLQRDLLPGSLPEFEPLELSATYRPADVALVGGDWYDAFQVTDGRLAVVVGDVAGNGIRAAASMGKIRHVIRACAGAYREPSVVLQQANLLICRANPYLFATACYLTIDRDGVCRVAAAGHLPAVHVRPDGARLLASRAGPPLGVRERATFRDHSFVLAPGESLVLYTDGLVERRDEALDDSLARLVTLAASSGPWREAAEVVAASAHLAGRDDVVVLLVHRPAVEADVVADRPALPDDQEANVR